MGKLDLDHELWRLEGRTFHAEGRCVVACNDGGGTQIAKAEDAGTALAIAHGLEAFFSGRQHQAQARARAEQAAETARKNRALTPGMIDFMQACQTEFPPVHCPTALIGEALAEMGLAVYRHIANPRPWNKHMGTWELTDAGRAALKAEGGAEHGD